MLWHEQDLCIFFSFNLCCGFCSTGPVALRWEVKERTSGVRVVSQCGYFCIFFLFCRRARPLLPTPTRTRELATADGGKWKFVLVLPYTGAECYGVYDFLMVQGTSTSQSDSIETLSKVVRNFYLKLTRFLGVNVSLTLGQEKLAWRS